MNTLKKYLIALTKKILSKYEPSALEARQLVVTPHHGMQMMMDDVDKQFGSLWNKATLPSDSIETIMYRAGAKGFRDQLLRVMNVTSSQGINK